MAMLINQTAFQSSLGGSLADINNAHTKAYIPVIIFVVCVIVVGFPSNVLAFIFFSKKATKSSFHCFISALSLNDAFFNIVLVKGSIDLFQYINNDNIIGCKIYYFVGHWMVGNSLLLMVALSVDRLRRVVYPFARQVTIQMARNIIVGVSFFSLSISVHYFYTRSIEHITFPTGNNRTVVGYVCARSKEYPQVNVQKIFLYINICFHMLSGGFLIISYVIIVKKLISIRNKVKSKIDLTALRKIRQDCPSGMATVECQNNETLTDYVSNEAKKQGRGNASFNLEQPIEIKPSDQNTVVRRLRGSSCLSKTERAFSVSGFVISVAFIICIVTYYVNVSISETNFDGKSLVISVVRMFLAHFFMLYSIVNPLILFCLNSAFRKFVANILCCLCKKSRNCSIY
ncbi:hypothetical protein ACF0H5_001770 [Mactra antiquata]